MTLDGQSGQEIRIGVAVRVPEPFATVLRAARLRVGDPAADLIEPHITLLGPTVLPVAELPAVDAHLTAITSRRPPFVVHLRGTASFRPVSPVVFVEVVDGIGSCELLEGEVRSGVLDHELRFHYHPHVTIAHDVADAALDRAFDDLAQFEARFVVSDIHVYEHGADGMWRTMGSYPLTGRAVPAALPTARDAGLTGAS